MMLAGQPVPVHPNGPSRFNPIHEDDIIAMLPTLLDAATVPATIVNWGGDEETSIEEWCEYMAGLVGCDARFDVTDEHDRRHPHRQHEAPRARGPDHRRLEGRHAPDGGSTRGWRHVVTCRTWHLPFPCSSARSSRRVGRWSCPGSPTRRTKWAKTIEVARARRTAGLRLDLGLRPLPQRARARARDDVRVLDDACRAQPAHDTMRLGQMVGCAPYRQPGTARQDHVQHRRDSAVAASTGASARAGTSTSTTATATRSRGRRIASACCARPSRS